MPVSRRTYNDLRARVQARWGQIFELQREIADLERERDAEQTARRALRRRLTEAEGDVRRLDGQVRRLEQLLKTAQQEHGTESARTDLRLDRVVRACARYRAEAAGLRRPRPAPPGGRALELSDRARRSLDEQLRMLGNANDAMCRELVDQAGTLAKVPPAAGEPGVAS
ncbi:hypothetical protein [Streptomyces sp. NPDC002537]